MHTLDLQKEIFSEKEKRNIEILDIFRKRGPLSRAEISQQIGVNVVTVSNYIEDFIKNKLVYEKELDVSEGGRRPVLLDLNSQAGLAIGVGLNLTSMVGLLIDLKGNIITKTQLSRPRASVKEVSECLLEIVREILKRSKGHTENIRGIGVGIAGLINKRDSSVHWPQKTDHYYTYASVDIPLKTMLEREFNLPTLIENDATSACFGERWLDLEHGYKNVIYMFSGVGCGIMLNGEIYRGWNGYAGEVSIYNYKEQDLFNCAAGDPCFLKPWEIDLGIVDDVKARLSKDEGKEKDFFKALAGGERNIDLKTIFTAARNRNETAVSALEAAAKKLGIKIAYLVNLLNPQIVVIGGGLEEAGEDFLNKVRNTVLDWAFREATRDLKICYSQLRENAVAMGAAGIVLERAFAQI